MTNVNDPTAGEDAHRFAQRRAANAERFAQRSLRRQSFADRIGSVYDEGAYTIDDLLGEGVALDFEDARHY
jgi:hypothetical protein